MKNQKGITLIALIITIIVLLILAGISISFVVGDNGILSQAGKAKTETDIAEEREFAEAAYSGASIENYGNGATLEQVQSEIDKLAGEGKAEVTENLDATFNVKFVDSGREYTVGKVLNGIDWNAILADANEGENYKKYKYSEETTSEYIAIGTDGKPVDMELWTPTKIEEDGTWLLGNVDDNYDVNDAYKGEITSDGKIIGCVPQYIYNDEIDEFTPVTKMRSTFSYESDLKIAPKMPNTVTDMFGCFAFCSLLEVIPKFPENLTNITYTFFNCKSLKSVPKIPDSVTSIGDYAFCNCPALNNITIPNTVITIGVNAFSACISLTNIIIPNGVTTIGMSAFQSCTSLTNIIIPNSVTSIDQGAFMSCRNLSSIEISNGITIIKKGTFFNCSALTSVTIPSNVNTIEDWAFRGCKGLESVIISKSVTTIGDYVFGDSSNLTNVYYTGTENEWNAITIGDTNSYLVSATMHYNYVK